MPERVDSPAVFGGMALVSSTKAVLNACISG